MKPKRIQLKRTKGWRMPPNTVKVDRTTKWGNPFKIDGEIIRDQWDAMFAFEEFLMTTESGKAFAAKARNALFGKNLACWCKEGTSCHADVLLRIANE
jgi:hypothetical protein